jgi:hypothetical protein
MQLVESSERPAPKLVKAERLIETVFDEGSRPSLRTLRGWTKAKAIPFVRIGHGVWFNPDEVRRALSNRHTIKAKGL